MAVITDTDHAEPPAKRQKERFQRRILAGNAAFRPGNEVWDAAMNHYFIDANGSFRRTGQREVSKKKAKILAKQGIVVQERIKDIRTR